ncbi:MAG: helix-hairpin-helix domain-containing protein [Alphaproteobacteria bacterium]|nr:helix-hairpin-helix domain-containing protein [Alphaproteobacteria bacterium]
MVEVRGDVADPGFHAVDGPARVHAAVRAAGGDPTGMVDGTVPPGTRVVVEGGAWRAEPMDEQLVVGLPVDVNSASATALQAVPGVGESRARAIVAEREAHGPFRSVDDLERVRGIGPATVDALRPFVAAGQVEPGQ